MFKKFNSSDISGQTILKSSVQRSIRAGLLAQLKLDPDTLEQIWPKKEPLVHVKCRDHISLFTLHGEPLFFQHFDGPYFPTLKLLHKYLILSSGTISPDPFMLPALRVDRGAIRFLLSGAHMMCPGFTSAGGQLPPPEEALPENTPVAIHAEGKEHAVGIGITKLSTEDIKKINKGLGVEVTCYLGDDLWNVVKL